MSDDATVRIPPGLDKRQRGVWAVGDLGRGRGLEIGPLHNPFAPRHLADVSYVDVYDQAELVRRYLDNPRVPTERIPTIDFPLLRGDTMLDIPEAVGDAAGFDWVLASHVVEHVPDLIGWLDQIARVTVDHGRLVLVVPDRRYTFDIHRPATSVGQVLEAHESGSRVPSVRAVYDHHRSIVTAPAVDLWAARPPTIDARMQTREQVLERVQSARDGIYVDSHVWTFTPGTFAEQIVELRELGKATWAIQTVTETPNDWHEFVVVLRRLPREQPWDDQLFADEPERPRMPDWLDQTATRQRDLRQARVNLRRARRRTAALRARLADLEGALQAERARGDDLEQRLGRRPTVRVRRWARSRASSALRRRST